VAVKWLVKLCDCGSFLCWFLEGDPQVGTRGSGALYTQT